MLYVLCRALFAGGFKEDGEDAIKIQGVSYSGMEYIIGCMYEPGKPINQDSLKNILAAASLFQTNEVLQKCEEYMRSHITESTYFKYLQLAETYSLKSVIPKADKYILKNFLALRQSDDFKLLDRNNQSLKGAVGASLCENEAEG